MTTPGLPCPSCDGLTRVIETRRNASGLRRRRVCMNGACNGKLTTYEIASFASVSGKSRGDRYVLVPRRLLARLLCAARDFASILAVEDVDYGDPGEIGASGGEVGAPVRHLDPVTAPLGGPT